MMHENITEKIVAVKSIKKDEIDQINKMAEEYFSISDKNTKEAKSLRRNIVIKTFFLHGYVRNFEGLKKYRNDKTPDCDENYTGVNNIAGWPEDMKMTKPGDHWMLNTYTDTIMEDFSKYDPNHEPRKTFFNYIVYKYEWRLKSYRYRNQTDQIYKDHVYSKTDIDIKEEMSDDAKNKGILKKNREYEVLKEFENENGIWYKIKFGKNKRVGYVKGSDVILKKGVLKTSEIIKDGEVIDIINTVIDPNSEEGYLRSIESEEIDKILIGLIILIKKFYKNRSSGKFSKTDYFRLFYTEKLIIFLKDDVHYLHVLSYEHENKAIDQSDIGWLDYLMTDICRTFEKIRNTKLKSYCDVLEADPRKEEINLSPRLEAKVYGPFLHKIGVELTDGSLAAKISDYIKDFNKQYNAILKDMSTDGYLIGN